MPSLCTFASTGCLMIQKNNIATGFRFYKVLFFYYVLIKKAKEQHWHWIQVLKKL